MHRYALVFRANAAQLAVPFVQTNESQVHIYACVRVYGCACNGYMAGCMGACARSFTNVHMHTCTHAHMHRHSHAQIHRCADAYHMHMCAPAHISTRTHAHMHTCTHAHHVHMQVWYDPTSVGQRTDVRVNGLVRSRLWGSSRELNLISRAWWRQVQGAKLTM